jgi:hypothetical protein
VRVLYSGQIKKRKPALDFQQKKIQADLPVKLSPHAG